jgi:hypothetical protein
MKNKLIILTVFFSTACGSGKFTTAEEEIAGFDGQTYGSGDEDYEMTGSTGGDLPVNTGGTGGDDTTSTGGNDTVSTGGNDTAGTGGVTNTGGESNTGGVIGTGGVTNTGGAVGTGGAIGTGGVTNTGGTGGVVDPCAITVSEPFGVADCSDGGIDDFEDDTTNLICNPKWGGQFGLVGIINITPQYSITRDLSTMSLRLQVSAQNALDVGAGWVSLNNDGTEYVRVDASSYNGISFYAKNNTPIGYPGLNKISLGVHTADTVPSWMGGYCTTISGNCWNGFFAEVELTQDWKKYYVPFCAFQQDNPDIELDPKTILQVQVLARPDEPADPDESIYIDFLFDDISFE